MRSNSDMNSCFSFSAARCGLDDGKFDLIAGSSVVGPSGKISGEIREKRDEILVVESDLDDVRAGRKKTFDFGRHGRVETYGRITKQTGVVEPELLG